MKQRKWTGNEIRQDLEALYEVEVMHEGKKYAIRSPLRDYVEKY